MKRIIASAGMVALGAASLQAAYAPGLSPLEQSKPWSIGLALRGFYDDNPTSAPNGTDQDPSWGIEVSPFVNVNVLLEQTLISFNYTYDMRWFENRPDNNYDQYHFITVDINHAFSERYVLDVRDQFTVGVDPTVTQDQNNLVTVLRTDGDYIYNNARVGFDAGLSEQFGLGAYYVNDVWSYSGTGLGNNAAYLNRIEQYPALEAKYNVNPNLVALVGAQYGSVVHTANPSSNQIPIYDEFGVFQGTADPKIRDLWSLYGYGGVEMTINPQLNFAVRLGVQYSSFYNVNDSDLYTPAFNVDQDDSSTIPYADASLTWTYNPGCSFKVGVVHTRNQTDITALDQESTMGYVNLVHRISPKITASAIGLIQDSEAFGGVYDGEVDMIYRAGINLNYAFNQNLSADVGYSFDRDDSDIPGRSYSRNRVYFGLLATY